MPVVSARIRPPGRPRICPPDALIGELLKDYSYIVVLKPDSGGAPREPGTLVIVGLNHSADGHAGDRPGGNRGDRLALGIAPRRRQRGGARRTGRRIPRTVLGAAAFDRRAPRSPSSRRRMAIKPVR
ncbi:MAG: hypothetical protein WDN69_14850 [Aliidongia sp.]